MKKAAVVLFLLLPALSAFGRNATEQEIARALKRALMARDSLSNGAEVQVASAVATGKDVCLEYRATTSGLSISGLAVYHIEDDLVFLDNSWKWESACLSGKYGQRRTGKDLTHALNASLAAPAEAKRTVIAAVAAPLPALPAPPPMPTIAKATVPAAATPQPTQSASAIVGAQPAPSVNAVVLAQPMPVTSAAIMSQPAPKPLTAPASMPPTTSVVAVARPAVLVPPAPLASAVVATPVSVQVAAAPAVAVAPPVSMVPMPIAAVPAPATVAIAAPAPAPASVPAATTDVILPAPKPAVTIAPAPTTTAAMVVDTATLRDAPIPVVAMPTPASNVVRLNPAASVETPLHGVTISDPEGALGPATQTISQGAPQESLADAARRVRRTR